MTISSSAMQFVAGFITSLITLGRQSINGWLNKTPTHKEIGLTYRTLALLAGEDLASQALSEYLVTLKNGEQIYIAASNCMDAAYDALQLSEEKHTELLDVVIINGEETLLPQ